MARITVESPEQRNTESKHHVADVFEYALAGALGLRHPTTATSRTQGDLECPVAPPTRDPRNVEDRTHRRVQAAKDGKSVPWASELHPGHPLFWSPLPRGTSVGAVAQASGTWAHEVLGVADRLVDGILRAVIAGPDWGAPELTLTLPFPAKPQTIATAGLAALWDHFLRALTDRLKDLSADPRTRPARRWVRPQRLSAAPNYDHTDRLFALLVDFDNESPRRQFTLARDASTLVYAALAEGDVQRAVARACYLERRCRAALREVSPSTLALVVATSSHAAWISIGGPHAPAPVLKHAKATHTRLFKRLRRELANTHRHQQVLDELHPALRWLNTDIAPKARPPSLVLRTLDAAAPVWRWRLELDKTAPDPLPNHRPTNHSEALMMVHHWIRALRSATPPSPEQGVKALKFALDVLQVHASYDAVLWTHLWLGALTALPAITTREPTSPECNQHFDRAEHLLRARHLHAAADALHVARAEGQLDGRIYGRTRDGNTCPLSAYARRAALWRAMLLGARPDTDDEHKQRGIFLHEVQP